jgi:predicted ATPase with chaperone activity
VARTIADLAGAESIQEVHLAEALTYGHLEKLTANLPLDELLQKNWVG